MKNRVLFPILFLFTLIIAACASRDDGDDVIGPDGGNVIDGNGDLTVDPPAESVSWACRSGVDANGDDYMEFNPQYLNNGAEATAFVVGQAPGESIVGYFTGSYRQGVVKNAKSGWYRINLQGTAEGILTYARCVDTNGGNAACWAQYGLPLPAVNAGPFRTCNGNSCACKFKPIAGQPAQALGGN
jgi:hypothetical protein